MTTPVCSTQNNLLMNSLIAFYNKDDNLKKMVPVVAGETRVSLRDIYWFVTNYAKKNYTVYDIKGDPSKGSVDKRFKVYTEYKLMLKSYTSKRFDFFCRWNRINIPYTATSSVQTTLGQLNGFKWVLENNIIQYIEDHYDEIKADMNNRNTNSRKRNTNISVSSGTKTRKKREELSISATKSIKREDIEIVVEFS